MVKLSNNLFWRFAPFIFVIFWSGGYSFAKLGLKYIEPMTMLAVRYGIAALMLFPFLVLLTKRWPKTWYHWFSLVFTGFLIQCIYFGLTYLAFKKGMNAGSAAVILSLQPVLVAAFTMFFNGVSGGRYIWIGLLIGFVGVLLATISNNSLGPAPWTAVTLVVSALLGMTIATLFEQWHELKTHPAVAGFVQYLVGFIVLSAIAKTSEKMVIDWRPELFISLTYLIVCNSIISVGIYIGLLQRGNATSISSLFYLVPPFAVIIAWIVLGEAVTPLAIVGFGLSTLGVYIINNNIS